MPRRSPREILVFQGEGGFAGEDLHRLAHRRLGPILRARLGEDAPGVHHIVGAIQEAPRRGAGEEAPAALVLPAFRDQLWASLEAIEALARSAPTLPVILSGWGADPDYLDAIGPSLDHRRLALARGEPEEALADALEALTTPGAEGWPAETLEALGLALPDGRGGWSSRGRFRQVADPASLPSVYETVELSPDELDGTALIEVARGCRHRCRFCLSCNFSPPGVRPLPRSAILAELDHAARAGATTFALLCSALNYDPALLEAIADHLEALLGEPEIESTIHAGALDVGQLETLSRLRFRRMIVGLQSITPAAAEAMGRAVDPPRFRAAIEALAQSHRPTVELILGLPGDTLTGFIRSLRFTLDLPVDVEVYHLRLDPGARFFRDREALGLEADFSRQGRVTRTTTFSAAELERAAQTMSHLARKRPWPFRARSLGFDFHRLYPDDRLG